MAHRPEAIASTTRPEATLRVPGDYPTIRTAIDAAQNGDRALVKPGTYAVHLRFWGKAILVTGVEPGDSTVAAITTLVADSSGPILSFRDVEDRKSSVRALTVSGQGRSREGTGLLCENALPTVVSCIFRNHRRESFGQLQGEAVHVTGGEPAFVGCRFFDNELDGAYFVDGSALNRGWISAFER